MCLIYLHLQTHVYLSRKLILVPMGPHKQLGHRRFQGEWISIGLKFQAALSVFSQGSNLHRVLYFDLFSMLDASSVITHTLMFTALVRGIRIYPWNWENWICLRAELYGYYLSSEMCASSGPSEVTSKPCVGDRNCGQNAECTSPQASRIQKQGT